MDKTSSLYIHIPFCISKCAYCDFFSRAQGNKIPDSYISALCNEITYRINLYKISELKTIYVGGGTPSLLSENQIITLFNHIKSKVKLSPSAEITVEVNPDDVNQKLLEVFDSCGVNRISCGIQSMNDKALKAAYRRADAFTNRNALELLRKFWKHEVSVDLISGLPGDDEKTLLASLREVCGIKPAHVSLYSLTIEEETPFGKMLSSGTLDYDFDEADKVWLSGRDFLEKCGYKWYEVSNFCREGFECRHNLAYWTHSGYLGCGSGATGTVYKEDGTGFRWTDTQNVENYIDFWNKNDDFQNICMVQNEEAIDAETSGFEFFMMSLRKTSGFAASEYENIFGKRLPEKFIELFESWQKKGLCQIQNQKDDVRYSMSRQGMLVLNRFLVELC